MEFGWLSILPPIIAIGLALITKEVFSSLFLGIFAGALIYTGGHFLNAIELIFEVMGQKIFGSMGVENGELSAYAGNIYIVMFLCMLGALVVIVTRAGGSRAYGEWASKKIKTKRGASLATSALGGFIFIDDYFNCLTVGTVMRPLTDRHGISRQKLAYIIDSTAAPICIIAPISSWAAAVASNIPAENGLQIFMETIPYNLYAILTIIMVLTLSATKLNFGPMAKYEKMAEEGKFTGEESEAEDALSKEKISQEGRVFDLIIPIVALILGTIVAMLYVGGFFSGEGLSITEAFGSTDAPTSLVLGGIFSLAVALVLFVPRKLLSFHEFMDSFVDGVKSMVPAILILCFAWTLSGICRDWLHTGEFVAELVKNSTIPTMIFPAVIFLIASLMAFAMGTSWGTFGILIPIVFDISQSIDPAILVPVIAATLAGSVFGDHISPISDTTILASAGAKCNHISHVSTQMIYAITVAACCFVGYIVAGIVKNVYITLAVSIVLLAVTLYIINKITKKKQQTA